MRYAKGHKLQTRARIVQAAAREFRRNGIDAISVADIMEAEGLTHGGFYRHFKGKQALLVESVQAALDEIGDQLLRQTAGLPRPEALARVISFYLSEEHMLHPQSGCAFAALATDLARFPVRLRAPIARALDHYRLKLNALMPGNSQAERNSAFDVLFSSMAGCLMTARIRVDPERRKEILQSARKFFIATFCVPATQGMKGE